ncbi:ABC transporter substrate-binding protein [Arthrobacter sp. zg-Y820]|uniref:ABC transporter substrate-binding protein n=1 Tax=unclassified Arthrobacter TaxID=235627 RepID=UPI001E47BF58|nr:MULTISPECIES: ABC transporter substrate-binding protein [unclassified Arthrobacter]MCC9197169.1 ABC transporter substrate-binding protein [Arthrobacter sp. zg-Y820]MDK1280034.1 ABC transporter substrate-binding protein [Arthrobacter sp. zg.Y820]WIB09329.1 ABC transporter substrate-binding protein [Arthrobacter sp. zg-Y820]
MRAKYALTALAAGLLLTGCVDNSAAEAPAVTTSGSDGGAETITVEKNEELAAKLPAKIREAGVLNVGMANNYPPNEFKDPNGDPAGWSVDLTNALGQSLGLTVNFDIGTFDNIIPSVNAGKDDMGMSSFTDTVEREKQADFINYYSAGIQWASPQGKDVDPNNSCGLKVAVQTTTYEDTHEVPAKSKACTDAGKPAIEIFRYDTQDQATNALVIGQVDAMSADSPVTLYAISKSDGKLQTAGDPSEVAPYGIPMAKGSELTPVLQEALQALIDDGTYNEVLSKWGVESGGVETAALNVAAKG